MTAAIQDYLVNKLNNKVLVNMIVFKTVRTVLHRCATVTIKEMQPNMHFI